MSTSSQHCRGVFFVFCLNRTDYNCQFLTVIKSLVGPLFRRVEDAIVKAMVKMSGCHSSFVSLADFCPPRRPPLHRLRLRLETRSRCIGESFRWGVSEKRGHPRNWESGNIGGE